MKTYRVVVNRIGDIGCVEAESEDEARLAALSKYGSAGGTRDEARRTDRIQYAYAGAGYIYDDDEFNVRLS